MIRRLLHIYWRFSRGLTLGVRAAIFDAEGRVFLVKHGYSPGWHLPGGGVETGETFEQALAREMAEEANVTDAKPVLHAIFQNPAATKRDHVAVYVVREFQWKGPVAPSFEIRESGFFPADRLPDGVTEGTRRRLAEILKGMPVSQIW
jgi:ADP-ribose pyrophosphatase YjhB (NUDIX family)